jgi:hypothetical protein
LRNRTSRLSAVACAIVVATAGPASAFPSTPTPIVTLDASVRAEGNRIDIARRIGEVAFRTRWPAQVLKVAADGIGPHVVAELRISGVKFHAPLTRTQLLAEVAALIRIAMLAAPVEEVDVAIEIPVGESKGVPVSGDLAKPTSRTVFTISVRAGESAGSVAGRLRSGQGIFWDEDWAKSALKEDR